MVRVQGKRHYRLSKDRPYKNYHSPFGLTL
jgi:hypothetical protein